MPNEQSFYFFFNSKVNRCQYSQSLLYDRIMYKHLLKCNQDPSLSSFSSLSSHLLHCTYSTCMKHIARFDLNSCTWIVGQSHNHKQILGLSSQNPWDLCLIGNHQPLCLNTSNIWWSKILARGISTQIINHRQSEHRTKREGELPNARQSVYDTQLRHNFSFSN